MPWKNSFLRKSFIDQILCIRKTQFNCLREKPEKPNVYEKNFVTVAVQQAMHEILGQNYGRGPSLSRPEAGVPAGWEAWLAAEGTEGADEATDIWAAEDD